MLLFLCLAISIAFGLAVPLTAPESPPNRQARRSAVYRSSVNACSRLPSGPRRTIHFWNLLAEDTMEIARLLSRKASSPANGFSDRCRPLRFRRSRCSGWCSPDQAGSVTAPRCFGRARPARACVQLSMTYVVTPGNRTVRKRADQPVTAQLIGFTSGKAQMFARFREDLKVGAGRDGTARQRISVPVCGPAGDRRLLCRKPTACARKNTS